MIIPISLYFVLTKVFGRSQQLALVCGACVVIASILWRAVRERKASQLELMTLFLLAVAITTSFVSNQPRIILITEAVQGIFGSFLLLVTSALGRPLITIMLKPFLTKGSAELEAAWDRCWSNDSAFRRRLSLLGFICSGVILVASVSSLAMVFALPLDYAVPLAPITGAVLGALALVVVKLLDEPLRAGLDREREALARQAASST
ncbi:MAG: VC0807 family protein [Segniliparus sp.]|uniref:VC0807 family protein n=1 Tax=Segniliparus sp. TaxID=2804064 RepID=UPI003F2F056F